MTYIKLEEVNKILDKYTFHSGILRNEINSLPSINPESLIEEMIEELKKSYNSIPSHTEEGKGWIRGNLNALNNLLQKFKS